MRHSEWLLLLSTLNASEYCDIIGGAEEFPPRATEHRQVQKRQLSKVIGNF